MNVRGPPNALGNFFNNNNNCEHIEMSRIFLFVKNEISKLIN
jgi:hypothetical protein